MSPFLHVPKCMFERVYCFTHAKVRHKLQAKCLKAPEKEPKAKAKAGLSLATELWSHI